MPPSPHDRPIIGITADSDPDRYFSTRTYADAVARAGGTPLILPHCPDALDAYFALCDGFLLTGGDDPRTESFGQATHPKAVPLDPRRQEFETALLKRLQSTEDARPVLGICLGMQMMSLVAGGKLHQHLPDSLPTHEQHHGKKTHEVRGDLGSGVVHSHHHQAVADPGSLAVIARAPDGVIEAVRDPSRPFHVGVQWHPERMGPGPLGLDLIADFVSHCRKPAALNNH